MSTALDTPIFLSDRNASLEVRVHPVVLFSIADHFTRRQEHQKRVIGTLLGVVHDNIVEVRNCFALPHTETAAEVKIDMNIHYTMLELHQKIAPREVVVGWYSTGDEVDAYCTVVHQGFYANQTANPVLLTLDTTIKSGDKMAIRAYVGSSLGVTSERTAGVTFTPVKCDVRIMHEAERVGISLLQRTRNAKDNTFPLLSELEHLESAVQKLQTQVATVIAHVDKVLAGKVPADGEIGRILADAVSSVPKFDAAQFEKLFNSSIQDFLMIMYLGNLTRTQLTLADRLNSAVF